MAVKGTKTADKKTAKKKRGRPSHNDKKRTEAENAIMFADWLGGFTLAELAKKYGYADPAGPKKILDAMLEKSVSSSAEEYRRKNLARYEVLIKAHWPQAIEGDGRATETVVALLDRTNKISGAEQLPPIVDEGEVQNHFLRLDLGRGAFILPYGQDPSVTDSTA